MMRCRTRLNGMWVQQGIRVEGCVSCYRSNGSVRPLDWPRKDSDHGGFVEIASGEKLSNVTYSLSMKDAFQVYHATTVTENGQDSAMACERDLFGRFWRPFCVAVLLAPCKCEIFRCFDVSSLS